MHLKERMSKIVITCGTVCLLASPVMAGSGNDGVGSKYGNSLRSSDRSAPTYQANDLLLVGNGKMAGNRGSGENGGHGPGDGTGNDGDGPKDGSGYGPGDCTSAVLHFDGSRLLVRGGNGNGGGNGGHGPGDGTGNGGDGPADGTGNGPGTGTCINS